MRRTIPISALCGMLAAAPAAAQYPAPVGGQYGNQPQGAFQPRIAPPVSPYLNLLRGGDPGVNYYNFVRPFTQPLGPMGPATPPSLASAYSPEDVFLDPQDPLSRWPRPTGHPAGFLSYQSYYNTLGTMGAPMQRPGAAQRQQQPMTPIRR
jgi:hypothetical protein